MTAFNTGHLLDDMKPSEKNPEPKFSEFLEKVNLAATKTKNLKANQRQKIELFRTEKQIQAQNEILS